MINQCATSSIILSLCLPLEKYEVVLRLAVTFVWPMPFGLIARALSVSLMQVISFRDP